MPVHIRMSNFRLVIKHFKRYVKDNNSTATNLDDSTDGNLHYATTH